jgi:hypothetical protein
MNEAQKDLRVSDVMMQMSVSQAAVLSWIKSGRLEAYNVAICETARPIYRVTQEALEAFKRSRGITVKNDRLSRKKKVEIADKITKFF